MLERLVPHPRLVEIDHIDVKASPEAVWRRVRHGELEPSAPIRALFALRTLPARLRGERSSGGIRLDDLVSTAERPGFRVLAEAPPRVVAVGAIGKVWKADIPFVHTSSAEDFAAFSEPGFVKVAWSLCVWSLDDETTRLELELRVTATDDASWRKFRRYFRLIGPASRYIRRALLDSVQRELEHGPRPSSGVRDVLEGAGGAALMVFHLLAPFLRGTRARWGVDEATAARRMPGDELVPEPLWSYTHGVEVQARAQDVWPWLAQIGANRGGFYSYEWLENVAGCALENADALHPEWQLKGEGDRLWLHPKVPPLHVVRFHDGHHFVAYAAPDEADRQAGKPWVAASWLLMVEPLAGDRCRVLSRYRAACSPDLATRLGFGPTFVEPISFAMDRRMLLGVKERAERARPCV